MLIRDGPQISAFTGAVCSISQKLEFYTSSRVQSATQKFWIFNSMAKPLCSPSWFQPSYWTSVWITLHWGIFGSWISYIKALPFAFSLQTHLWYFRRFQCPGNWAFASGWWGIYGNTTFSDNRRRRQGKGRTICCAADIKRTWAQIALRILEYQSLQEGIERPWEGLSVGYERRCNLEWLGDNEEEKSVY